VIVLDNLGNEFVVNLEEINPKRCTGKIIQKKPAENEPNVKLHLFAALTQRDKFELILQKCSRSILIKRSKAKLPLN
jgi:16S rRNA U1498 N3-methylase RsmE